MHPVSGVAVDEAGTVVASIGEDLDREFFLRSSPKPLQASVSQRNGAALLPEQLAIAASSHSAFPVHVAHVTDMLLSVGLGPEHLLCPPDLPSRAAAGVWAQAGRIGPERVFHNCSGKHAAMLRACVAQGWSLEYTDPGHPLQLEIASVASEASGRAVEPVGIDGCGVPTLRSDVTGLARIFSRLVHDPDFAEVASACSRHTPLTADGSRPEAVLNRWVPCLVKGGAEGCIGMGTLEHGVAFGVKSWTGHSAAAVVGLVALMDEVGIPAAYQRSQLQPIARPDVLGGGHSVGALRPIEA